MRRASVIAGLSLASLPWLLPLGQFVAVPWAPMGAHGCFNDHTATWCTEHNRW
jgi:hypothetical protein